MHPSVSQSAICMKALEPFCLASEYPEPENTKNCPDFPFPAIIKLNFSHKMPRVAIGIDFRFIQILIFAKTTD